MSLRKWPALSGGSAITLDIWLPHSLRSPSWMVCVSCLAVAGIMNRRHGSLLRFCTTLCMQTQQGVLVAYRHVVFWNCDILRKRNEIADTTHQEEQSTLDKAR